MPNEEQVDTPPPGETNKGLLVDHCNGDKSVMSRYPSFSDPHEEDGAILIAFDESRIPTVLQAPENHAVGQCRRL
jgi:hypothetical protein